MDLSNPNLFSAIPDVIPKEIIEVIVQQSGVRIERIISKGQQAPEEGWFDQEEDEWVVLLEGLARISYPDNTDVELQKGDYLYIPAHQQHRVSWTTLNEATIWLAIFWPVVKI